MATGVTVTFLGRTTETVAFCVLLVTFLILCAEQASAKVLINEIMYNPAGDEFDFEYIELFGEGENISRWSFEGIDFTFPENTTIQGYLVIANTLNDTGENNDFLDRYVNVSCRFEYMGNLLNTGETIILRDSSGAIVDVVDYDDWAAENHSIERLSIDGYSSDPKNWAESLGVGTPGQENSVTAEKRCDWAVSVVINSSVSFDPTWQIRATKLSGDTKANMSVAHWIEDSHGAVVKNYSAIIIENALSRSTSGEYTPTLAEGDGYFIKANITDISCSDRDMSNNFVSELIFVQRANSEQVNASRITIKDVDLTNVRFGDVATVDLGIYRGDTAKYAIDIVIKGKGDKVSETVTFHAKDKFTNYTLRVPIQLKPNCNEKYDDGTYEIVVEGLGVSDKKAIKVEGIKSSLCDVKEDKEKTSASSGSAKSRAMNYELLSTVNSVAPGTLTNLDLKVSGDDKEHTIDVWAYVYRGPKRYSETLEKKRVRLEPFGEGNIVLPLIVNKSVGDGMYKLKILFQKDGQKTMKEITQDILVKNDERTVCVENDTSGEKNIPSRVSGAATFDFDDFQHKRGIVVYESSSLIAQKIAPIAFGIALLMLAVVLVFKKI